MFELLQRFFKFIQSSAHALLSRFENPISLAEQGIRDLKKDFDESMQGLAQIKATAITTKRELEEKKSIAQDYEQKAMLLLQKAQSGELEQSEADRLAAEALTKKNNALQDATKLTTDLQNYTDMSKKMEGKISDLKSKISSWENELQSLKARYKVASTTKKINQQLASLGSDSTTAMLADMKTKIQSEEALAIAYEDVGLLETDVDKEINKALGHTASPDVQLALAQLKSKMITDNSSTTQDSLADKKLELGE